VAGATWALLIYTVPASPTRKRAAVWREVKRLGALYLRDGVCALPDTSAARAGLEALAERIQDLDGQATLVWQGQLSAAAAQALHDDWVRARELEYAEVAEAAVDLLQHVQQEARHHGFEPAQRVSLSGDLARMERWLDQVVARDYLQTGDPTPIAATLTACRAVLDGQVAPLA